MDHVAQKSSQNLSLAAPPRDFRRYRKLRRFVFSVFLHAFFWDVLLARGPQKVLRRPALGRWLEIARRYRALAVEMGGVLIKLGQFLSTRVDLLPPEIVKELQGLQDEVPAEPYAAVIAQIEEDFGRPIGELFAEVSPEILGAASLAQVHSARLLSGERVVVKALRPGIERLVETDLAAVGLAIRLLRFSKKIRRRVDLARLADEIARTTRAELDLRTEAQNAERFAEQFANDPRIRVPKIYLDRTARRTLTAENVAAIKISDRAALVAAGLDPAEVARVLYRTYMRQIFEHSFVHADPHPGNLFVEALPADDEEDEEEEEQGDGAPRDFRITFIDFGMMATVPPRLRGALKEYAIALGTRDAKRLVEAYAAAGVLLPGADLTRLEEVHRELFARFWGVSVGRMRDEAMSQARYFLAKYKDLLYELPFQVEVDLLFVSRAVGLLAGLATSLDPEFDPWAETLPFAERLAKNEAKKGFGDLWGLLGQGVERVRAAFDTPRRLEELLGKVERGEFAAEVELGPESRRLLERVEAGQRRSAAAVLAGALAIAAAILAVGHPETPWAAVLGVGAVGVFWWGSRKRGNGP